MFALQTLLVNSQLLYRLSYRGIKLYKEQYKKHGYYTLKVLEVNQSTGVHGHR
jgi:hypothetical protein